MLGLLGRSVRCPMAAPPGTWRLTRHVSYLTQRLVRSRKGNGMDYEHSSLRSWLRAALRPPLIVSDHDTCCRTGTGHRMQGTETQRPASLPTVLESVVSVCVPAGLFEAVRLIGWLCAWLCRSMWLPVMDAHNFCQMLARVVNMATHCRWLKPLLELQVWA